MSEDDGIRPATPADVAAVAALLAACFADPWSEVMIADSLRHGAKGLVVPGPDAALDGCVLVQPAGPEAEILQVAVAPARRRTGLGRRLVRQAIALAAACGAEEAFLEVRPHNLAAIALYESEGFRQVGRRRRYYADGDDALLMRRALRGAPGAAP